MWQLISVDGLVQKTMGVQNMTSSFSTFWTT